MEKSPLTREGKPAARFEDACWFALQAPSLTWSLRPRPVPLGQAVALRNAGVRLVSRTAHARRFPALCARADLGFRCRNERSGRLRQNASGGVVGEGPTTAPPPVGIPQSWQPSAVG